MATWRTAKLDEIDEISDGRVPWRPVRHHFGISSFGVNTFTGKETGERIINEHDEADEHEELYFVHSGRARFELGDETLDAPAGTFVFVERGLMRTAFAEEPGTTLVVMGGQPGEAYAVHGYDVWAPLVPLHRAERYDELAARLDELFEQDQPYSLVQFNAACIYSLTGQKEKALRHLRRAVELSENVLEYAKSDTDLDAIRGEPEFAEIVG